jgi:hypothetical protein
MTFLLWSIPFCSSSESTSVGSFFLDLKGEKLNGRVKIGRMDFKAYGKQFEMPVGLEGMIHVPVEAARNLSVATWEGYERPYSIGGGER